MMVRQDTSVSATSKRPLFSIITVTLNCANAAADTARSVLSQDCDDYEYLVKDGGSSDRTCEVLRALGLSRLISEPDTGIYDAMNQAVHHSRGEYLCFLNAGDTFVTSGTLRLVASYVHSHAWPSFLYGDVVTMQRHPVYRPKKEGTGRTLRFPDRFDRLTAFLTSVCQQSWFVRRELCLAYPFDVSFRLKADHDFFLYWLLKKQVHAIHVPHVLVRYIAGGQSEQQATRLREEHHRLMYRYFTRQERFAFSIVQRVRQVYRVANYYLRGALPAN
jgi:glycosyltransferase involved in cell wall biosynthesis